MVDDFEDLLIEIERDWKSFEDYMHNAFSRLELDNNIQSSKQNTRKRALSILAFLYIPLSFVTSFFGMNVGRWGTGTLPLWFPIAAGLALLAGMLFLVLLFPVSERLIDWCWHNLHWLPRLRITCKFSLYPPRSPSGYSATFLLIAKWKHGTGASSWALTEFFLSGTAGTNQRPARRIFLAKRRSGRRSCGI